MGVGGEQIQVLAFCGGGWVLCKAFGVHFVLCLSPA